MPISYPSWNDSLLWASPGLDVACHLYGKAHDVLVYNDPLQSILCYFDPWIDSAFAAGRACEICALIRRRRSMTKKVSTHRIIPPTLKGSTAEGKPSSKGQDETVTRSDMNPNSETGPCIGRWWFEDKDFDLVLTPHLLLLLPHRLITPKLYIYFVSSPEWSSSMPYRHIEWYGWRAQ